MSRVYGWMTGGLCVTGRSGMERSRQSRTGPDDFQQPALVLGLDYRPVGSRLRAFLADGPHQLVVTATLIYFLYAALTGLTLSGIFLAFTGSSIAKRSA